MEKNNIKCIILDVDGTLTNSNDKISDYTKNVLNEMLNKNIKIILASGRNLDNVIKVSKECNICNYVIANNGATVYDYLKEEFIFSNTINKEKLKFIWDLSIKYNVDCIFNSYNLRYKKLKNHDKKFDLENDILINDFNLIKKDVYQVVLLTNQIDDLNSCIDELKKSDLIANNKASFNNGISLADINEKGISKGNAIEMISKKINITKNNIICFGDSINDIEMFKKCKIKVAMKNASDELKEVSNRITEKTNDEDGVANFIKTNMDLFIE